MLTAAIKPGYRYDRSCLWDRATLMPLWARGGQEASAYDQSCMHLSGAAYRMPEFLHGALGDLTPDIDFACTKQGVDLICLANHSGSVAAFKALKAALLAKAVEYNTPYQFTRLMDPDDRITVLTVTALADVLKRLETLKATGYPLAIPGDLRVIVETKDTALLAAIADRATALVAVLPTRAELDQMALAIAAQTPPIPSTLPATSPGKKSGPSRLTTGLVIAGVVMFAAGLTFIGIGGMKRRRAL